VVIRVSAKANVVFSNGVSVITTTDGTDRVYTVTATSTDSETVTIS
jgi:hypothetical protein